MKKVGPAGLEPAKLTQLIYSQPPLPLGTRTHELGYCTAARRFVNLAGRLHPPIKPAGRVELPLYRLQGGCFAIKLRRQSQPV